MCYQVVCLFDNSILIRPEDYVNLVIGSGASILISPHKTDFMTNISVVQPITLKELAEAVKVQESEWLPTASLVHTNLISNFELGTKYTCLHVHHISFAHRKWMNN